MNEFPLISHKPSAYSRHTYKNYHLGHSKSFKNGIFSEAPLLHLSPTGMATSTLVTPLCKILAMGLNTRWFSKKSTHKRATSGEGSGDLLSTNYNGQIGKKVNSDKSPPQ